MNAARVRAALLAAHAVPVLTSLLLVLVLAEVLLPGSGVLAVSGFLSVAAMARTPAGERVLARVLVGARTPTLHERHVLAPLAAQLIGHGVRLEGLRLLVARSDRRWVQAVGRRTVVVTKDLVAELGRRRLCPDDAAAVLAHEIGTMRAGLTTGDAALRVLLLPWRVWSAFIVGLWAAVGGVVGARMRRFTVVGVGALELWRGWAVDPVHLLPPAFLAVAWLTYRGYRRWETARWEVGDEYVAGCGLARSYAALLSRGQDRRLLERAARLYSFHAEETGAVIR